MKKFRRWDKAIMKVWIIIILLLSSVFFLPIKAVSQTFTEVAQNQIKGQHLGYASWCDVNADGYLDIFITGHNLVMGVEDFTHSIIYLNDGNGSFFETNVSTIPRVIYGSHDWGDFNNDGQADLLLSGTTSGYTWDGLTRLYLNDQGNFQVLPLDLPGAVGSHVQFLDFDSDGWQDIFIMGFDNLNQLIVTIYKNINGESAVESGVVFRTFTGGINNLGRTGAAIRDFDNDGDQDIILGWNSSTGFSVDMYENTGSAYVLRPIPLPQFSSASLAVADFNSDGLFDVVINGIQQLQSYEAYLTSSDFVVLKGEPGLNFSTLAQYSEKGTYWGNVSAGDMNSDGRPDILVNGTGNGSARTKLFINSNGNGFSEISNGLPGTYLGNASLGDFDNDGDLDLLVTGSINGSAGTAQARVYRNDTAIQNDRPSTPKNTVVQNLNGKLILSWDRSVDSTTPTEAITYNIRIVSAATGTWSVSSLSLVNGTRLIESHGNSGLRNTFEIELPDGKYYWQVQSLDAAYFESEFSPLEEICIMSYPQVECKPHYCYNETVRLNVDGTSVKWYDDMTLNTLAHEGPSLEMTATENREFYVTQTANGCTSQPLKVGFSVSKNASVSFFVDGDEFTGDYLNLTKCSNDENFIITAESNYDTEKWEGGTSNRLVIDHSGVYTLVLSDDHCTVQKEIAVDVESIVDPFIPNVITPGNDQDNELFILDFLEKTEAEVTIYNRDGRGVYHAPSYKNDFNGNGLSAGTYYYRVKPYNCSKVYKGWLHIMK
jgi:hypothetical protein